MSFNLTEKEALARSKLILPLDGLDTLDAVAARVAELKPVVGLYKVGMESYTRFGPAVVEAVRKQGGEVFLDLKYLDIPQTVRGAAKGATDLGVYMFNVHALGGEEMMVAAYEGVHEAAAKRNELGPYVIGVTILTSIDEQTMNKELRIPNTVEEQVLHLAKLTRVAGLDGIVCSATDLPTVRSVLPPPFLCITPGIKGVSTSAGADQKRVDSPGNAIKNGASYLVVGRAITAPATPEARLQAGYEILQDMAKQL